MKIDHVAMYVNDLEAEKNFFVKYFNAKASSKISSEDFSYYFLKFEDGSRLEIMSANSVDAKNRYHTGFHKMVILLDDRKDVDDFMKKIYADGVIAEVPREIDDYYAAVVVDPEGNESIVMALINFPF